VAEAAHMGWQFPFRRQLTPDLQIQLARLRILLDPVTLTPGNDMPIWDWNKSVKFSVKSVYKDLSNYGNDRSFKHLWKAKIPLKIKIWLWLIWHNAIATKDTMSARGWTGNTRYQFCEQNEAMHHLFFTCVAAKFVWNCVARSIGAPSRLGNFSQFFWWFPSIFL
jgi:hypothetical protein